MSRVPAHVVSLAAARQAPANGASAPSIHPAIQALEAVARSTTVDSLPDLIGQVEAVKARLYSRLTAPGTASPRMAADRLLDVREAAQKMCRSTDWLYRHAAELPFVVREGRLVRFSEKGIDEYISRRMGH